MSIPKSTYNFTNKYKYRYPTNHNPTKTKPVKVIKPTNNPNKTKQNKIIKPTWKTIHEMAVNAIRIKSKQSFEEYMISLGDNYPCYRCRLHIKKLLEENPISFEDVSKWSWEFHNKINKSLSKPIFSWDDYIKQYM